MSEYKFEASMNAVIMRLCRAYFNASDRYLKKLDLHCGQPHIILSLYKKDGKSIKELSDSRKVKASTTTVMVSRMEKSGIVERKADSDDRRITRVYLTEKGKSICKEIEEINKKVEEECLKGFSETERIIVKRLIDQMIENLNEA